MPQQLEHRNTSKARRREIVEERPEYLRDQLITYIGNKRNLLGVIGQGLQQIKKRLGKKRLRLLDGFSGSGVVSRFFKQHAELVISNDTEAYAEVIGRCYLANACEVDHERLQGIYVGLQGRLRNSLLKEGIIARNYAPKDDGDIQPGERVFYKARNARYLDTARMLLEQVDPELRHFFLAPLLSAASVHVNTSGVFKGFYKCSQSGVGKFGGNGGNALTRILGDVKLRLPVFSRFACDWKVYRVDINTLVDTLEPLDVAYFDPPYNQHPYGSNYFMLNLLVEYRESPVVSRVSGIPSGWYRSRYNARNEAVSAMRSLVAHTRASHLMVSFNDEGFISREEMEDLLSEEGRVETIAVPYNTFRGCRNLKARKVHVSEFLFIVER